MSIPLTVGTDTFNYPGAGDPPGWGSDASSWASAVTQAIGTFSNGSDVPVTQITIANNTSGAVIAGLVIDPTTVRSASITYAVYRTASVTGPDYAECGTIRVAYQDLAIAGSRFLISQVADGFAGITFDVDDTGQFTYTTTNLSATGQLTFKAETLLKTIV